MVNEHLIEEGETHIRKKRINVMEFHTNSELNNSYTFIEKELPKIALHIVARILRKCCTCECYLVTLGDK